MYYEKVDGVYRKYESNSGTDNFGREVLEPTHKSTRKLVINQKSLSSAASLNGIPSSSNGNWQKIDQTQTYVTDLLDFDDLFSKDNGLIKTSKELAEEQSTPEGDPAVVRLSELAKEDQAKLAKELAARLEKLVEQDKNNSELKYLQNVLNQGLEKLTAKLEDIPLGDTDTEEDQEDDKNWIVWDDNSNIIWFIYGGDIGDEKDCVYFNLSADDFTYFSKASYVKYVNIPQLPDAPRKVVDNDGVLQDWYYSYIVVNVAGTGTTDNDSNGNPHIHLSPVGSKVTTINHINISRNDDVEDDSIGAGAGKENNFQGVTSLMYNFYEADETSKIVIGGGNFQGTIFAPGAAVTDEATVGGNIENRGHLSGALIAKSFEGATEFGYRPFSGTVRMLTGDLTISKTVKVNGQEPTGDDATKKFTFTITLNDKISGEYTFEGNVSTKTTGVDLVNKEITFKDGVATVKLKHNEYITIKDLPAGTEYKVVESDNEGYTVTISGTIGETTTATGKIVTAQESKAEFTNTKTVEDTGSLKVSKTVTGNAGDKNHAFTFEITLKGENNAPINGNYSFTGNVSAQPDSDPTSYGSVSDYTPNSGSGTITFTDGVATVYLAHNQSITITGLPAGTTYTVKETDSAGHTVTKSGDEGKIEAGKTAEAKFTNTKNNSTTTTTSVTVQKVWDDDNSTDRPESITVQLYRNGTPYGDPVTLNAANNWRYTWGA